MGLRYEYIYISKLGPGIFFSLLAFLYQPDHYFLGGCGGDWEISPQKWCTAKTENKVVQMEMGKNIDQVRASASTIISWIFYVKKILARAIAHQINCAQPKCEE